MAGMKPAGGKTVAAKGNRCRPCTAAARWPMRDSRRQKKDGHSTAVDMALDRVRQRLKTETGEDTEEAVARRIGVSRECLRTWRKRGNLAEVKTRLTLRLARLSGISVEELAELVGERDND